MAESDIELLSQCAKFTLTHTHDVEKVVLERLRASSATPLVTTLRILRLQRTVLAIGMFSLFESLLQDQMKWNKPFERLNAYLKERGESKLAQTFTDYVLAINVLKHGTGRSYERLLDRGSELEFSVKPKDKQFFDEGDVSEIAVLIDVNDEFVHRSAKLIQDVASIIQLKG